MSTEAPQAPTADTSPPIRIDPELEALLIPLDEPERQQLEDNLKSEGCRDPLVVWLDPVAPDDPPILCDGHNRREICDRLAIPYRVVALALPDRDAVKLWMIRNQLGRRNLDAYHRVQLALRMKEIIEGKALANRAKTAFGANPSVLSTLTKPGAADEPSPAEASDTIHTRAELARLADVSEGTFHKVEFIEKNAAPEVKAKLARREVSINGAYTATVGAKPKEASSKATGGRGGAKHDHVTAMRGALIEALGRYRARNPDATAGDALDAARGLVELLERETGGGE